MNFLKFALRTTCIYLLICGVTYAQMPHWLKFSRGQGGYSTSQDQERPLYLDRQEEYQAWQMHQFSPDYVSDKDLKANQKMFNKAIAKTKKKRVRSEPGANRF